MQISGIRRAAFPLLSQPSDTEATDDDFHPPAWAD